MKVKQWEMTKEDLEKLGSRIMLQTMKALVDQNFMFNEDARQFLKENTILALTPDCIDESLHASIFNEENLNAHCIFKVVRIK
jgi:hypothetical protein